MLNNLYKTFRKLFWHNIIMEYLERYASNPNYVELVKKTIKTLKNERVSDTN